MTEKPLPQQRWLTEGLVIATFPVFGYYMAYRYETGYLGYFGVPDVFVSVTADAFFAAFAALISGLLSLFAIANLAAMLLPKGGAGNLRLFMPLVVMLIFAAVPIVFWSGVKTLISVNALMVIFIFLYYVTPIFQPGNRSFVDKLRRSFEHEAPIIEKSLYARAEDFLGRGLYLMILASVLILPMLAGFAGAHAAAVQKRFLSATIEGDEFVLLRKVGDNAIFIAVSDLRVDKKERKYIVRELNADAGRLKTFLLSG